MTHLQMLALFACTFANVFFIGLQSRNVNAGRYTAAIITSFGISAANFIFIHFAATGSAVAFTVSAIGGCLGIAGSIWFYQSVMSKKEAAVTKNIETIQIKIETDTRQAIREVDLLRTKIAMARAELLELVPKEEGASRG